MNVAKGALAKEISTIKLIKVASGKSRVAFYAVGYNPRTSVDDSQLHAPSSDSERFR